MFDLYDGVIEELKGILSAASPKRLDVEKRAPWQDAGGNNMVLAFDAAYELGGSRGDMPACGGSIFTENDDLVSGNGAYLIGSDLPDIVGDVPYARISFVRLCGDLLGEGDALYDNLHRLMNVRYSVNPKGFMMRVSSIRGRECVRVSKEAISDGISFSDIGAAFNTAFMRLPQVKAVMTYFITAPDFDFEAIKNCLSRAEDITRAIDHVFSDVSMNCGSCNLKEVCDEVEGLKELHFGLSNKR